MPFAFPNRVRFSTVTTGTGTISVGTVVSGFQTPGTAGVAVGSTVGYGIEDGTNWEVGTGTFQTGLITRDVVEASSSGGAKISLSGTAQVYITATGGLLAPLWDNRGRNKIINPLFKVQQRGAGAWTSTGYTADRWLLIITTDTVSATVATLSDAQRTAIADEEALYALQAVVTGNAAAGASTNWCQRIEDLRKLAGKTVTISFYAVAATSFKIGVSVDQVFGSGGSPSSPVTGNGSQVTLATSFARYSVTLPVASVSGKTLGTANDHYTAINLWLSSGATNNTRAGSISVQSGTPIIWGVQVEIGSSPTPLEKPEPALDLEACQRFYQVGQTWFSASAGGAAQNVGFMMNLPVTMRGVPTISYSGQAYTNAATLSATNLTVNSFIAYAISAASGSVLFSGIYTASAEL
jgi:hypothetical protein